MNLKTFFKPKQFINNLPTKLSWALIFILATINIIKYIPYFFITTFDVIKKALLVRGGHEIETAVSSVVIIQALLMLAVLGLMYYILKIGILSLMLKGIIKIFKHDIKFFKLINIYLYSKIISTGISLFITFIVISKTTYKLNLNRYLLLEITKKQFIQPMLNDYLFMFFAIVSTLSFLGILFYGTYISLNKK